MLSRKIGIFLSERKRRYDVGLLIFTIAVICDIILSPHNLINKFWDNFSFLGMSISFFCLPK